MEVAQFRMKASPIPRGIAVPGGDGIISEVTTITPQSAAEWLKANKNNRPVRRRHVEFLANEILSGNWQVNGQAIVISDQEEVLDGQHRLMAVIEAGQAIQTLVVYGIGREAFKTIDTGAVRSGSDALALFYPNANGSLVKTVGSAVPWCLRMEAGFYGDRKKISNTDVLDYVSKHRELWSCAEILNGYPKDTRPLSQAMGTACYEIFRRKDPDLAEKFMRAVYTGEQLSITRAEYVLRSMLIRDAQRLSSYPAEIKMKMVVKAWNWTRRGRGDETSRPTLTIYPNESDRMVIL